MIDDGDENAKTVYQAMAYQLSKAIGELATVVNGKMCIRDSLYSERGRKQGEII